MDIAKAHDNISPKRLKEISDLLARSNKLAKELSDKILGNRKYPLFRAFFRGEKVNDKFTPKQLKQLRSITLKNRKLIIAGDSVDLRNEVATGFLNLLHVITAKFGRKNSAFDTPSLLGQAYIELMVAMNNYTDNKVKFITYAHNVIYYNLSRYCKLNNQTGLSGNSSNYLEISRLAAKVQEELLKDGKSADYHALYEKIQPQCNKIKNLHDVLRGVTSRKISLDMQKKKVADGEYFTDDDPIHNLHVKNNQSESCDDLMVECKFDELEQKIVRLRIEGYQWDDISEKLDTPIQTIRMIHRKIKMKAKVLLV